MEIDERGYPLGFVPKRSNELVVQVLSDESELDHSGEVFCGFLESREDASAFLEPADETFNDVAATVRLFIERDRAGVSIFILP